MLADIVEEDLCLTGAFGEGCTDNVGNDMSCKRASAVVVGRNVDTGMHKVDVVRVSIEVEGGLGWVCTVV